MTGQPDQTDHAARELVAEVRIGAAPAQVWRSLVDLRRMPARSPSAVREHRGVTRGCDRCDG